MSFMVGCGSVDAPGTEDTLPRAWPAGFIYPIPGPPQGWASPTPFLRKALFAQLTGRALANFLLKPMGPGKPMPGSWDFLLAGPLVNAGMRLCFVCQAHPGLSPFIGIAGLTPSGLLQSCGPVSEARAGM